MAWYHVNGCDCPVGNCDCGSPRILPSEKRAKEQEKKEADELAIIIRAAKEDGICVGCGCDIEACICGEII